MVIKPKNSNIIIHKIKHIYYDERCDIIMRIKLIIIALIVLSVVMVRVKDDGKEAYRSNSGLTVKI
ncbi:MAG TPA: hypothetical protein DEG71_03510 [Clostridiales bacterium]|nr:hypothetical protein [Clostridiales bacterium]